MKHTTLFEKFIIALAAIILFAIVASIVTDPEFQRGFLNAILHSQDR